jgi:2-dehydropantoate 2-reductase
MRAEAQQRQANNKRQREGCLRGEVIMRVAVLGGGGAMGGIVGGWLQLAGHDVTLIDISSLAVDAINEHGLHIEEKDGSVCIIPVRASLAPQEVGPVDLIINFVKCYHTDQAVRSALPMVGPDTVFLTLQNGWGNADRIAAIVGADRVLVGLTYHGGTLLAPGRVKHPGIGKTYIGEVSGLETERLRAVVDVFNGSGLEAQASSRVLDEVWKKLALNACTLPTSALLHFQSHELVAYDSMLSEMRAILEEVVAVAHAQGIALAVDERWAAITGLLKAAIGGRSSMLQDVEGRRQTEIDVINGAIVAAGRRCGVPTPHNDAMVWMIKSLEAAYLPQPAQSCAA